jgi:U3 small nucleolar RNA-associated protein 23
VQGNGDSLRPGRTKITWRGIPWSSDDRRFEVRSCGHRVHLKAARECLASLVENANSNHYIVATQDMPLRKQLRLCQAVPLLYVNYNVIVMEPPGESSRNKAKQIDQAKLAPREHEQRLIEHLKGQLTPGKGVSSSSAFPQRPIRKRKAKAPNPLSVLKKRKKASPKAAPPL